MNFKEKPMVAKKKKVYVCSNCGYESPKWFGRCPQCGEWNTSVELNLDEKFNSATESISLVPLTKLDEIKISRFNSGINELDRVLGGGIVPGSVVLIGGDPGVGKTTLMMEMCSKISENETVLFISGEESAEQIMLRAERIGIDRNDRFIVAISNELSSILKSVEELLPKVVVIDSIQSVRMGDTIPGGIVQLRECTGRIVELAKRKGITFFLVGHITKAGEIAGPKVLEHMVDAVLYFEGEVRTDRRILRSMKNRYGPTNELAIFEMTDKGLKEVEDPSLTFVESGDMLAGSCVAVIVEGIRPFLVEIQALVLKTNFGMPRRLTKGLDVNRVMMITAVMNKRLGIPLEKYDIYVNVIGGLNVRDPGVDLAVATAIYSSLIDAKIRKRTAFFGEVGLDGRVRKVFGSEKRVNEAKRAGFENVISPDTIELEDLGDILKLVLE